MWNNRNRSLYTVIYRDENDMEYRRETGMTYDVAAATVSQFNIIEDREDSIEMIEEA